MVSGEGWMKTYETYIGRNFKDVKRTEKYKFGNEVFPTVAFKKFQLRLVAWRNMLKLE